MAKGYDVTRVERRIPIAVAVQITGHSRLPGVETTFTENVSSRGARVYSSRRWRANDRVRISTLSGDFQSVARVAWCSPAREQGFSVGLEFLEKSGYWVVTTPAATDITPPN